MAGKKTRLRHPELCEPSHRGLASATPSHDIHSMCAIVGMFFTVRLKDKGAPSRRFVLQ